MPLIPSHDQCRRAIHDLVDEPELSSWEYDFVSSNLNRTEFTDKQKEAVARLMEKYDLD